MIGCPLRPKTSVCFIGPVERVEGYGLLLDENFFLNQFMAPYSSMIGYIDVNQWLIFKYYQVRIFNNHNAVYKPPPLIDVTEPINNHIIEIFATVKFA
jgi:hypothetical protein